MFDKINVDGEDHELWNSTEDSDMFGMSDLIVIGITEDGLVGGTVTMGPNGLYFTVEDVIFHLDLDNMQAMCSVFGALVRALSHGVMELMATEMSQLASEKEEQE